MEIKWYLSEQKVMNNETSFGEMATAGTVFPMNNKLQNKINLLSQVIEREKLEVKKIGKEMRQLITRKEEKVIKELDEIWKQVNFQIEKEKRETQKKIEKIETHAREISFLFEDMKGKSVSMNEISNAVESAKREIDIPIPYVQVIWRLEALRESIRNMCHCEKQLREDTHQLLWSACERGEGETQLYTPCGIAVNSVNENIYVADNWKHRVQVFSRDGEWISTLRDEQMVKPENILCRKEFIYVQCDTRILQFDVSTRKLEKSKLYDFSLRGICTDTCLIYVGNFRGMKLIHLTPELTQIKEINLNSKYCRQYITYIRDVCLAQDVFYVLFSDTDNPIQAFSKEGFITRCVIGKASLTNAYFFSLDQQLNLIVSDSGASEVKIFSNEGELLTRLSRQDGHLTNLSGVAVTDLGCVISVDWSQHERLQVFLPLQTQAERLS